MAGSGSDKGAPSGANNKKAPKKNTENQKLGARSPEARQALDEDASRPTSDKASEFGVQDESTRSRDEIANIAQQAFGTPSMEYPKPKLPQSSDSNSAASTEDVPFSVSQQGQSAQLFRRVVKDYLSKNTEELQKLSMSNAHEELNAGMNEVFADVFRRGDLAEAITLLKKAVPGQQLDLWCQIASTESHNAGKLSGLNIVGIDPLRNAFVVIDEANKRKLIIDAENRTIESQELT